MSIVGLLLLAITCVLFVPVRYRIRLKREEGEDKPPVVAYVKVTWLLHLVNVLIRYPAKVMVRARILIFTLFRIPEKEKKSKKREKKKEPDTDREASETQTPQTVSEDIESPTVSTVTEEYKPFGEDDEEFVQREAEPDDAEELSDQKSLFAKIRHIFSKIKQIFKKIKEFFENIQYTIRKFCDKIKAVLDNIQYYREVLESDSFSQSAKLFKKELGWAFRKLKPDKLEADLIVGMEDPATTGEILAIFGILYPLIGQHVRVVGDFECEKMHIEGTLYIRGRIRVITFLKTALRIYFSKDIRKMMKLLRKKEAV